MTIKVPVINAFVASGSGGNPAGVVLDASKLDDQQMQAVATTVGASETAFVTEDSQASFRVRFFTPTVEVDLCGHATIATWSYMLAAGKIKPGQYTQNTLAGLINLDVSEDGLIFMEQPKQVFGMEISHETITRELGINEDWLDKKYSPQIVQKNLMLSFKSKQFLNDFELDKQRLLDMNHKYGFKGLHIFVRLDDGDLLAAVRDFDPIVGIDEDAATGTANGSFLTYLKERNALPSQDVYRIEQGEAMGQLSNIYGKFHDRRVWIGGRAQPSKDVEASLLGLGTPGNLQRP